MTEVGMVMGRWPWVVIVLIVRGSGLVVVISRGIGDRIGKLSRGSGRVGSCGNQVPGPHSESWQLRTYLLPFVYVLYLRLSIGVGWASRPVPVLSLPASDLESGRGCCCTGS